MTVEESLSETQSLHTPHVEGQDNRNAHVSHMQRLSATRFYKRRNIQDQQAFQGLTTDGDHTGEPKVSRHPH